jgi:hypothetical protein
VLFSALSREVNSFWFCHCNLPLKMSAVIVCVKNTCVGLEKKCGLSLSSDDGDRTSVHIHARLGIEPWNSRVQKGSVEKRPGGAT